MFGAENKFLRGLAAWLALALCVIGSTARAQNPIAVTNASFSDLQVALIQAGQQGGGLISIQVDGEFTLTSQLVINNNITIDATGFNVVISGNDAVEGFLVTTNSTLTLSNIIIAGCSSTGAAGTNGATGATGNPNGHNGSPGGAGTPGLGGGVFNKGTFYAFGCSFTNNGAFGGNGGTGGAGGSGNTQPVIGGSGGNGTNGLGGAIYNLGTMLVSNCTFSANIADGGSGGAGGAASGTGVYSYSGIGGKGGIGAGAAIYNLGKAYIFASTFNNNLAQGGDSAAAGSQPQSNGSGQNGPAGAVGEGAGICNIGTNVIINCTFFGNETVGGTGGAGGNATYGVYQGVGGGGGNAYGSGIYNLGSVAVTNATIVGGSAIGGTNGANGSGSYSPGTGSPGAADGANIANSGAVFDLKNSILAYPTNGNNAFGTIVDQTYNLSSDNTPALTATGSQRNTDPLLAVLGSYGGPTQTMALENGSPAIGTSDPNFRNEPSMDQRGSPRPSPGTTTYSIGAYEFAIAFSIQGRVGFSPSLGMANVLITATGTNLFPFTATTTTDGGYTIPNVPPGVYSVFPSGGGFFTPPTNTITVSGGFGVANFTVTNAGKIFLASQTNHNVQISFAGIANQTYSVQASTNLSSPTNWVTITNLSSGASGSNFFTTSLTNFPQLFFQVVTP